MVRLQVSDGKPAADVTRPAPALKKLKGLLSALLVTDENDLRSTCVGRQNRWQKQCDGGQSMRLDASI
jgi:hypothetical protein